METFESINQCPSFERLNQAIEELRNAMNSILNELSEGDEDEKKDYIMDYLTDTL